MIINSVQSEKLIITGSEYTYYSFRPIAGKKTYTQSLYRSLIVSQIIHVPITPIRELSRFDGFNLTKLN